MLTSAFLEFMNGQWFALTLCVTMIFGAYIGVNRRAWREPRMSAAIAIFTFFCGESISRGWVWWWRHSINQGLETDWMIHYPILIVGSVLGVLGALCCVRVFSTQIWGDKVWVIWALTTTALSAFFAFRALV